MTGGTSPSWARQLQYRLVGRRCTLPVSIDATNILIAGATFLIAQFGAGS
jgi:hypothetical protein